MAGNSLPGISCKWQIRFLLLRRKKRNILKLTGLYSMRKICSPAVLCLLLCFLAAAGCRNKNRTAGIQMTVLEFSGSLELKLEHFLPDGKVLLEQMPGGFDFSSGAGGWATYFNLHTDGTFTGRYHDSDMGDAGTGYSAGTVYVCNFDGKFSIPERTGRYTYAMTLEYLNGEGTPGTEYYEDNIRYIYSEPYGFDDGEEFLIYLPGCPLEKMSEELLFWSGMYTGIRETLPSGYYVIYNVNGKQGFVGMKEDSLWGKRYTSFHEGRRMELRPSYYSESHLMLFSEGGEVAADLCFAWARDDGKEFQAYDSCGGGDYRISLSFSRENGQVEISVTSLSGYDFFPWGGTEEGVLEGVFENRGGF